MRPMRRRVPLLKHLLLQSPILRRHPLRWRISSVYQRANKVRVTELSPMHLSRIPDDQIAPFRAHLHKLTTLLFVPL